MSQPPAASADYSLRILWSLARWVEDKKGTEALEKVAEAAGVRARDFDGSTVWVSHEQFETILTEARALVDGRRGVRKGRARIASTRATARSAT